MQLLLLYLLFSSSFLLYFGAWFWGRIGSIYINLAVITIVFFCGLASFETSGNISYWVIAPWFESGLLHVQWALLFDSVTEVMILVVLAISLLVHIHSIPYMYTDPALPKFLSYLTLFTFFMLILVTSANMLLLFLGWEGVGLCSYLLINFWSTRLTANKAALKALIINRIGDFGLLIGTGLLFQILRCLDYGVIFAVIPYLSLALGSREINILFYVGLFFLIGVAGKSAQLGLHTWLPDAMEGPTPVSALIHAATMVTAGVFSLIRCSPLFEYTGDLLVIIIFLGAWTTFFAGTVGFLQHDVKKIVAYSTCSQLGLMVLSCGLSNYIFSLYHLTIHACFKALLFLAAGSLLHIMINEQDIRKFGALARLLPITFTGVVIGSGALMGFPFLAGFHSKDLIIEIAFLERVFMLNTGFLNWIGGVAVLLTTLYSVRMVYKIFLDVPNGPRYLFSGVRENDWFISFPLIILTIGSIFLGFLFQEIFSALANNFFATSILDLSKSGKTCEIEFLPIELKLLPLFSSFFGFIITLIYYSYQKYFPSKIHFIRKFRFYKLYQYISRRWYYDMFQNIILAVKSLRFGYNYSTLILDKGFLEIFGPTGITHIFYNLTLQSRNYQIGLFYQYFLYSIISLWIISVGYFFIS